MSHLLHYLLETVRLDPNRRFLFIFGDGTGFFGTPNEASQYLNRRFAVFPDDEFEVIDDGNSPGYCFELIEPLEEGQIPLKNDRDSRF